MEEHLPEQRELRPTWLLVSWVPLCAAQIWLNASIVRRDGFAWGRMAIVIGASILLGMLISDLLEVVRRMRASRALREPVEPQKS